MAGIDLIWAFWLRFLRFFFIITVAFPGFFSFAFNIIGNILKFLECILNFCERLIDCFSSLFNSFINGIFDLCGGIFILGNYLEEKDTEGG